MQIDKTNITNVSVFPRDNIIAQSNVLADGVLRY